MTARPAPYSDDEEPKHRGAAPVLQVRDLDEAMDFYGRLGFREDERFACDGGLRMLHRVDASLGLQRDAELPRRRQRAGCTDAFVFVPDAHALFREVRALGLTSNQGADEWCDEHVEFDVIDPWGNVVSFISEQPSALFLAGDPA